ncbi:YitT family protein [Pisciglobus halotolerans]|uniref:Uncharacterized membrane-anchored protein YitT, contains DUF161 and DUF2179 domains n=1 Tax=Pisciglobus halotolerans TaxID=745365 RepID=A0A1I3BI81_9LACT|nr:YitT family protein [Pisciglobus halotolerans]SFH61649.1 Uncharacterized membrane-anchored protein YitT, contains DUF161 and DUF2179 domains [Pisciglobus halotolerans]
MKKLKAPIQWVEQFKIIFFIFFSAITNAVALNNFFIPANVYASGITGVAQLMSDAMRDFLQFKVEVGILILLFNIPIAIIGWIKIGRRFTLYSFISSLLISVFMLILPVKALTPDPIMNALFGGVIAGLGIGFALKYGFSTGGMDIISMVLAKTTGKTIGTLMMAINVMIVIIAGFLYGWEYAFYTLLSIYVVTKVIDAIHTSHQKITAMIVTQDPQAIVSSIHSKLIRGITVIPAKGAFSQTDRSVLMTVITRYEMYDLEQAVREADAAAFVNFMQTTKVLGEFWNSDQQKKWKKQDNHV